MRDFYPGKRNAFHNVLLIDIGFGHGADQCPIGPRQAAEE
jgi:hypothetical protein